MKRIFILSFVISILTVVSGLVYFNLSADVRESSNSERIYNITLEPGDRIIIIDASATRQYTSVIPASARILDVKVPDGKIMAGVLKLK